MSVTTPFRLALPLLVVIGGACSPDGPSRAVGDVGVSMTFDGGVERLDSGVTVDAGEVGPPTEVPVVEIGLLGSITDPGSEISSMHWYGDHLILLPEDLDESGTQLVYALEKQDVLDFVEGRSTQALTPIDVPVTPDLGTAPIPNFDGFEAIAFVGNTAFLTIESRGPQTGTGFLVSGQIDPALTGLQIDFGTVTEIPSQVPSLTNSSHETILVADASLVTIFEVNGALVNSNPVAPRFDMSLNPTQTTPMPNIEYRVTDATAIDADNRFWVINYHFPGDSYAIASDPVAMTYGEGPTHVQYEQVERLLELELTANGINVVGRPPIQLELVGDWNNDGARNWEGIVRLDDLGFLIATDRFPTTMLGFVAFP